MYSRYHRNVRVSYGHMSSYTQNTFVGLHILIHINEEKKKKSYVVYDYSYGWKWYWAKHQL